MRAMTGDVGSSLTDRARSEAAQGDWHTAFDLLVEADTGGLLAPGDLSLLGEVAYAAGHLDVTIVAWERAYTAFLQADDQVAAAGAALRVAMHLLFDTALMAPVRAWLARADDLLEARYGTPAHAWLGVVRAYERMLSGDAAGARPWARQAIDVGATYAPAACALGRVAEARLVIEDGDVQQGLSLLDRAGLATVSGELDPLSTGVVYCELVCALQALGQYDIAEEWTEAMERWCETNTIGSLHGRCRVHRAEILRLRGSCTEAESQALTACEELRPYLRRELGWPLNELGRIRLHKGDLSGAQEAFVASLHAGWDPEPGLALVLLALGDVATAASSIRRSLERPARVPWKERPPNTDLQRAPLLEAQVEIELAAGDIGRAEAAADELERISARFETKPLAAGAALANGRVRLANGDPEGAEELLSRAVRLWGEVGAPYEVARPRMCLAEAHATGGSEHRAQLERAAARTILEEIRAAPLPVPLVPAESRGTRRGTQSEVANLFRREGDYWSVTFDGQTVRIRDLKGMRYLARLLTDPGREYHVLDLVAAESGQVGPVHAGGLQGLRHSALGDAGEVIDAQAKQAYRRRLAEIDDDLEQAHAGGDEERAAQAETERDFLVRELARAFGLGGRERRAASASERARAGVTRAVRHAIARIGAHDARLGDHLTRAIHTGTYCSYLPDRGAPAGWRL
jgi:tetratricopeptide (TPR) repeat protein